MEADGGGLRQISFDSPGDASFPIWSADGTQIIFRRDHVNTIVDINKPWSEDSLRRLPDPGNRETFGPYDWSPDGKKILGAFAGEKARLGYYSVETNKFERLLDFGGFPMWLADSTRYVFISDGKIYLTDINTKRAREIFKLDEGNVGSLCISADGQMLYFTTASSESDIWLLDLR